MLAGPIQVSWGAGWPYPGYWGAIQVSGGLLIWLGCYGSCACPQIVYSGRTRLADCTVAYNIVGLEKLCEHCSFKIGLLEKLIVDGMLIIKSDAYVCTVDRTYTCMWIVTTAQGVCEWAILYMAHSCTVSEAYTLERGRKKCCY